LSLIYIAKILGINRSPVSIITSAILVSTSFFYVYTLASYFKFNISVLHNRNTYDELFNFYVVSKYVDNIIILSGVAIWLVLSIKGKARFIVSTAYIVLTMTAVLTRLDIILDSLALTSIPFLVLLLTYDKFLPTMKILSKNVQVDLTINYFVIIGLIISMLGTIVSSIPLIFTNPSNSMPVRNYSYELFVLLSIFSPILMALLILSFPIKLLVNQFITLIKSKIKEKGRKNNSRHVTKDNNNNKHIITMRSSTRIIYLALIMLLSVIISLIPHQPMVNKDDRPVGADTGNYVNDIKNASMNSKGNIQEFIRQIFAVQHAGDRPLTLLFLFAVTKMVPGDLSHTIDYLPIALGPALVLAVYFLARTISSNNDSISILASFLTAVSFHTLIGIYAGFYANLFALIIGYLSIAYLFKFLKAPSRLNFIAYSILVILLLFSHVYTWSLLAIVMATFLIVMLKMNYYHRRNIILLLLVILLSTSIDIIRTYMTGSTGGIEGDIRVYNYFGVGPKQFFMRWNNIVDTTEHFLGGLLGNSIILGLGLYWLFRANYVEPYNIFIIIFLSVGIMPLFFGDWTVQSRVFYNIPFQIPAAIGLNYIMQQRRGIIISLSICIWLIAISVVSVSNFYQALASQ
jgi:hypothetical protein